MRQVLKKNHVARFVTAIVLGTSLLAVAACKSKTDTSATGSAGAKQAGLVSEGTLLTRLPSNAFGFAYINLERDSYKRLLTSPWGRSNDWLSLSKSPEFQEYAEVFSGLGIDPAKPETWGSVLVEGLLYGSAETNTVPVVGLLRAPSAEKATLLVTTLKQQLEKNGKTYSALDAEGVSGIAIDVPTEQGMSETPATPEMSKLFVLPHESIIAVSFNEEMAKQAAKSAPQTDLALFQTPQFKRAFDNLGAGKESYAFGYIDVVSLLKNVKSVREQMEAQPNAAAVNNFESLVWTAQMRDTPEQEVRLVFTEAGTTSLAELKPTSGEGIARFMPANPMAVLSLDATVFGPMLKAVQESQGAAGVLEQQVPWLNELKKIGLAVSVGQPGMIPLPNVLISLQVAQSQQVEEFLRTTLQQLVAGSGMSPDASWQKSDKGGVEVSSMVGPMGLSLNLASKDGVVLLTNNAQELEGVLNASSGKGALPALVRSTIEAERILGMTLDFAQVSTLMQTMGGMLSLYAPQDEATKNLLKPESIEAVKKLGTLAVSLDKQEQMLVLKSKYHLNSPAS